MVVSQANGSFAAKDLPPGAYTVQVSAQQVDKIFRFNPATQEFTEFPLSYAQQDPRRIDIDPTNPNRIFFSGNTADRIGYIELLP
jgi:hypothetical protein